MAVIRTSSAGAGHTPPLRSSSLGSVAALDPHDARAVREVSLFYFLLLLLLLCMCYITISYLSLVFFPGIVLAD
jgi:hypothetical protein